MKLTPINAPDAPQPAGGYVQAMEVSNAARLLFISGQVPDTVDGQTPVDFEEQARLIWRNIIAQLNAADMTLDNLVKVTFFLSDRKYIDSYRKVRREVLQHRNVGLTTIITGIFDEKWLMEVEAIAAA
jgi:2-iminobutanoate/2-iminopropanoate deaminase